jgi:hypothetical protein
MGGCTRVARWCVWLNPEEGKRGTNALTYYELSSGIHTAKVSLCTGQASNLRCL